MIFVIDIDPIPQPRPRLNTRTKKVYSPSGVSKYKNDIRRALVWVIGPDREDELPVYPDNVPLRVDIDFVHERPKTMDSPSWPDGLLWRPKIPDRDNLDKAVLDACTGVIWKDDALIVAGEIRKLYAEKGGRPRICMRVTPAGDSPVATVDNPSADVHDFLSGRKEGRDERIPTGTKDEILGKRRRGGR